MSSRHKHKRLFNRISLVYGLFFTMQRKTYRKVINKMKPTLNLEDFDSIIDIGCGTGALCSVLDDKGLNVTGLDTAEKMIKVAKKKNKNSSIHFVQGDILETIPFEKNTFDIAIASYVAHGLKKEDRLKMYNAMKHIAKDYVIFHDYNKKRNPITSIIEWAEGGDYFYFIEHAEDEMRECQQDLEHCFKSVKVINVGTRSNWYICKV